MSISNPPLNPNAPLAPVAAPLTSAACMAARPQLGRWLALLGLLLAGYALFGKAWAYLGVPPLYIGEIVLLLGIASVCYHTRWHVFLYSPYTWLILAMCAWGALQTMPYLADYHIDVLRDAVLYGYSIFALIVMAHLVQRPEGLVALLERYSQATLFLAIGAPLMWISGKTMGGVLPVWPWSGVELGGGVAKPGDVLVHLAGVFAFWVAYPVQVYSPRVRSMGLLAIGTAVVAIGSESRGGLLSFACVFALCLFAFPRSRALWRMIMTGVLAMLFLAITQLQIPLGDRERYISFDQIVSNTLSIVTDSNDDLGGTKSWRLDWWSDIVHYTFGGEHFWAGKGFGVNLADADGYQVVEDGAALRSPHNGHLTVLARSGVIGLALWIAVQATWAYGIAAAFFRARSRQELSSGQVCSCSCSPTGWHKSSTARSTCTSKARWAESGSGRYTALECLPSGCIGGVPAPGVDRS